jgi:hypothetical protein
MRPPRSFGEVAQALRDAASQPRTVRDLAAASCVGLHAARYTASRLVSAGELVRVREARPALLVRVDAAAAVVTPPAPHAALEGAVRSFFDL